MDNQEQIANLSRDEYIRLARESCTRNLDYNSNMRNYGGYKNRRYNNREKFSSWNTKAMKAQSADSPYTVSTSKVKSFLIRLICAFVLFLTIYIIDIFEIKILTFNSKTIEEMVTTNQGIEDAEAFFVKLFEQLANAEK